MQLKKFLLFGLLAAVLPAFAEEAADRKTATSLQYVTHELDTRQNKFTAEQNKAMEYTDSAGTVQKRAVTSDLDNGGTDSLPMVGGVNTKLATKQDDIAPINDHTAVTYTGTSGKIGAKGIYQTSESYVEQSDNLIDAKTFNAALKRGLDSEFLCSEYQPGTDLCWVYSIHNNGPVNLFDMSLFNTTTTAIIYTSFQIPNGVYTMSTNFPDNNSYTNVFVFPGQVSSGASSTNNGVYAGHNRTITVTDGYYTVAYRSTVEQNTNNPKDYNWKLEQGSTATAYQDVPYTTLVPAGYTPVEWIASNGNQWIDTGVTDSNRAVFTMSATAESSNMIEFIISNIDSSNYQYGFGLYHSNVAGFSGIDMTEKHNYNIIYSSTGISLVYDGEDKGSITNYHVDDNKKIVLFGGDFASRRISAKLYNIRLYNNDEMVFDGIPAKQGNNVGLYDTVSHTFKQSLGTLAFTAGPDINNIIYVPQNQ